MIWIVAAMVSLAQEKPPVELTPEKGGPVAVTLDKPLAAISAEVEVKAASADAKQTQYLDKRTGMQFVVTIAPLDADWISQDEPVRLVPSGKRADGTVAGPPPLAGGPAAFVIDDRELGGRDANDTVAAADNGTCRWEYRPVGKTAGGDTLYVLAGGRAPTGRLTVTLIDAKTGKAIGQATGGEGPGVRDRLHGAVEKGKERPVRGTQAGGGRSGKLRLELSTDGSTLEFVNGPGTKYENKSGGHVTVIAVGQDLTADKPVAWIKGKSEGKTMVNGGISVARPKETK